ncbi:hypothetical protein BC827DRAFT_1157811 [Russula dissimulans]|nr:hypothetical protein BC827DRAFT_1157811 [Russula dissimulans]
MTYGGLATGVRTWDWPYYSENEPVMGGNIRTRQSLSGEIRTILCKDQWQECPLIVAETQKELLIRPAETDLFDWGFSIPLKKDGDWVAASPLRDSFGKHVVGTDRVLPSPWKHSQQCDNEDRCLDSSSNQTEQSSFFSKGMEEAPHKTDWVALNSFFLYKTVKSQAMEANEFPHWFLDNATSTLGQAVWEVFKTQLRVGSLISALQGD